MIKIDRKLLFWGKSVLIVSQVWTMVSEWHELLVTILLLILNGFNQAFIAYDLVEILFKFLFLAWCNGLYLIHHNFRINRNVKL